MHYSPLKMPQEMERIRLEEVGLERSKAVIFALQTRCEQLEQQEELWREQHRLLCTHVYTRVHTHVYTHVYTSIVTHMSTHMSVHMSMPPGS